MATPAPAPPTTAKLIPIVATADLGDAATLARIYFQRWPLQENIIRDFLIPLGIDTNHGYAKTEVVNSEVSKRREAIVQRLTTLKRWAEWAGERCSRAGRRHQRLYTQAKARVRELDRELCQRQRDLDAQALPEHARRQLLKEAQAAAESEMHERNVAIRRAIDESNREYGKQERYCQEQRALLRALEDLAAREPCASWRGEASSSVTSAPSAAKIGACCPPADARHKTFSPWRLGNQSLGTGLQSLNQSGHLPCLAAATSCAETAVV